MLLIRSYTRKRYDAHLVLKTNACLLIAEQRNIPIAVHVHGCSPIRKQANSLLGRPYISQYREDTCLHPFIELTVRDLIAFINE
ncbi:hypothetical protein D3C80_1653540 [compost metagenome]